MNLFLDHFIEVSIKRLQTFEPSEGYCLAFSGGKDSCVIKWLADKAGVKYTAHYNVTTIDPPELCRFIRKHHSDVEWHFPKRSFFQLMVDNFFPPTRIIRYCCRLLKEGEGIGRIITGVRSGESNQRNKRRMVEKCFKNPERDYIHPIIDWPSDLLWDCIHKNDIPYCGLYDEGFDRLGCVFCPMARKVRIKQRKRWPKMERAFRKTFHKMYQARIDSGKDNRHDNADDWFEWWISQ